MSQENVDIVRSFIDEVGATPETAVARLADDAELVPRPAGLSRLVGGGSQGPAGFARQVAEIADQFAEYEICPEQLRPVGDRVVAALQRRARSARSTAPIRDRFAQVFTLREGMIARIDSYSSFDEALEAAERSA